VVQFPGEDAPGTGKRRFPSVNPAPPGDDDAPLPLDMMTTAECYERFPAAVRADNVEAAQPLLEKVAAADHVPGGVAILDAGDGGPTTGKRRAPSPEEVPIGKGPTPTGRG